MKLKFINPSVLDRNLKATAHKSGKLGFTKEAAEKLGLSVNKSASIAINDEDPSDRSLYVIINGDIRKEAFKVSKAGQYYYLNIKALFDTMKIDYKSESVVYDITQETIDGKEYYKFKRRDVESKSKKGDD